MYELFKYERVDLKKIRLDSQNPRIVTQSVLTTQDKILEYLFSHEDLSLFLTKIVTEGLNQGAELPYVVDDGGTYVVLEGNRRIASYKVLTGQLKAPPSYANAVPKVSDALKAQLKNINVSIAPDRDSMLPIMASAHFGLGDKSRWGYLGSRKAVFDEHGRGKTLDQLSLVFKISKSEIADLIFEYQLYLEAVAFQWSTQEKDRLLSPSVQFGTPIRFLESGGHREKVGVTWDRTNLDVGFVDAGAKQRYEHLIRKLVVESGTGLKATSSYDDVFKDYDPSKLPAAGSTSASMGTGAGSSTGTSSFTTTTATAAGAQPKAGSLFTYPSNSGNLVVKKLMEEASRLNCNRFPGAGTALMRSLLEAILRAIIDTQNANPQGGMLSLEKTIDICLGSGVQLSADDIKILKEFKKTHLDYVNMGTHATVIPNALRLFSVRDCVDQFVKRNG